MIKKDIKLKIKEYFFLNPTAKLRVRQIERALKIPLPSAIRYVKELCDEQILQKITIAEVTMYAADRTSKEYLIEKKLYNIKKLYEIGLIDYIIKEYDNPIIVLFGSYSKGEDLEKSDVDIYIETTKEVNLKKYEKLLNKPIQIFTEKLTKINKELANNIINGTILNGYIEVFK